MHLLPGLNDNMSLLITDDIFNVLVVSLNMKADLIFSLFIGE